MGDIGIAIIGSPVLMAAKRRPKVVSDDAKERADGVVEVYQLLARWYGAPTLWWMAYRYEYAIHDVSHAWQTLHHAYRLAPETPSYMAMMVQLVPEVLPPDEAKEILERVSRGIENSDPVVVVQYALAELRLLDRNPKAAKPLAELLRVARSCLARADREARPAKFLAATIMLLEARSAGKVPTADILARSGLEDLLPSALQQVGGGPATIEAQLAALAGLELMRNEAYAIQV